MDTLSTKPSSPFVWTGGTTSATSQKDSRRRLAEALLLEGSSGAPVQSWTQGLNRVAQAMLGGYMAHEEQAREDKQEADAKDIVTSYPGFGAAPVANSATQPSTPALATPMGANAIPAGVTDPALSGAITKVAAARGVDPAYLTRTAALEGSGKNPASSANGYYQFLDSTAQQYGLADRNDPYAATDAAARLTLDNKAALSRALGRDPTNSELYLAHQQGAGGAAKLLANPNAPVEVVLGPEAARNNGATPGMTAGQFAQKWTQKFDAQSAPGVSAQMAGNSVGSSRQVPAPVADWVRRAVSNPLTRSYGMRVLENYAKPTDSWVQERDPQTGAMLQRNTLTGERKVVQQAPDDVRRYEYYKATLPSDQKPMPFEVFITEKARAGATNISNNVMPGQDEFTKETAKLQAKRFNELAEDAVSAKQMISDIDTLRVLGAQIGTGKKAQLMATLGPYAQAIGFDVKGLDETQAFEGIINRVAPSLRVKGSGAQSDYELRNFLKSLPSLGNQPGGNELVSTTLQGFYQNKLAAAKIGADAMNGNITRAEAEKALRELPDPMERYREFIKKANPGAARTMQDLKSKYGLE